MEIQDEVLQVEAMKVLPLEEKSKPSFLKISHKNSKLSLKRYSIVCWLLMRTFAFLTSLWAFGVG